MAKLKDRVGRRKTKTEREIEKMSGMEKLGILTKGFLQIFKGGSPTKPRK